MKELQDSVDAATVVMVPTPSGLTYRFKRYPFGELGMMLRPELIREIADGLTKNIRAFAPIDALIAPEPGGHTWALLAAHSLRLPLHVLRQRPSQRADELIVQRESAYSKSVLYTADLPVGRRVVVVDDVVSSGGTLTAIVNALSGFEVEVVGVVAIVSKRGGAARLAERLSIPIVVLTCDDSDESDDQVRAHG